MFGRSQRSDDTLKIRTMCQKLAKSSSGAHQEFVESSLRVRWEVTKNLSRVHQKLAKSSLEVRRDFAGRIIDLPDKDCLVNALIVIIRI